MGGRGSGRRPAAETIQKKIEEAREQASSDGEPEGAPAIGRPPALFEVEQPTGAPFKVQGTAEKTYYESQRDRYTRDFKFEDAAELADLDALLMHELLLFRYNAQLSSGVTNEGLSLASVGYALEERLRRSALDETKTIGDLKRQMGITRASKDAQAGNVSDYLSDLLRRAKAHKIARLEWATKAIVLANELKGIVGAYDRGNELERRVMGYEDDASIVKWVREEFVPQFQAVDDAYKQWQIEQGLGRL